MEGICYKIMTYLESSKILYVYTEKGKFSLVAKNAHQMKSDLRTVSQYLNKIEFKEPKGTMGSLIDVTLIDNFLIHKDSLEKIKTIATMFEVIDYILTPDCDNKKIYELVVTTLEKLEIELYVLSFLLKVLTYLGYKMDLVPKGDYRLVMGFSIKKGGLVYPDDNYQVDYDLDFMAIIIKLLVLDDSNISSINELEFGKIKNFIRDYYRYHLEYDFKNL
ncbi:MAG: DNA repair protein RecO [Acholeplasmatales bacterium]|jgi:DNA repair protein RecO (recombination protein O)|nr:DNA repair protein RecO [Acholeplasmatales bacterium]